jgi:hypothetical protein
MAIPQKIHSVIDNDVRAWPTHEIGYRVSVNDSRGCEEMAGPLTDCTLTGRCWSPVIVEIIEAAKRIDSSPLKNENSASACRKSQGRWLGRAIHLRSNRSGRDRSYLTLIGVPE